MSDFIAYQYNDFGLYIGEVLCQRDPRRNRPLLPKNCTFIKPPEDNGTYVWKDDSWNIITIEEKQTKKINHLEDAKVLLENPSKENIKEAIKKLMELL